jgi:integrase
MYKTVKGLAHKGQNPKSERERYLTTDEVNLILKTIKNYSGKNRDRDYCAVFCGFYFALRVGEACMLKRDNFRHLLQDEVHIRTLKCLPRLSITCQGCGRRYRVSVSKIGQTHTCIRCSEEIPVNEPHKAIEKNPPEREPPVVESKVIEYLSWYLKEVMRPDQQWLFEGQHAPKDPVDEIPHITESMLEKIFTHWVNEAGLPLIYSWHSLRHARGMFVFERFGDLFMVQKMLRQSSLKPAERYLHMSPTRKKEYKDALDEEYVES